MIKNHEERKRKSLEYYYRFREANKIKRRDRSRRAYAANAKKRIFGTWKSRIKRKYGITYDDYLQMFATQNGVCKLCFRPPHKKRLSIDHCHRTGKVRGLLCLQCNKNVVGTIEKFPGFFERLGAYLEKNSCPLNGIP